MSVSHLYARTNSISTLLGVLRDVVFMYVILDGEKPLMAAASFHSSAMSVGITIEIFPSAVSSDAAFLKKLVHSRVSLCRASVRDDLSHFRLLMKYGGLQTMVSNSSSGVYCSM